MSNTGEWRTMILARFAITLAVLLIVCGLLFVSKTEVAMNIANGILGGLIGYWFSVDNSARSIQGVNNGVINENAGGSPAPRSNPSDAGQFPAPD